MRGYGEHRHWNLDNANSSGKYRVIRVPGELSAASRPETSVAQRGQHRVHDGATQVTIGQQLAVAVGHVEHVDRLDVRAARVETLGAEAVDVFYVTDGDGKPLGDGNLRRTIVHSVLAALGD